MDYTIVIHGTGHTKKSLEAGNAQTDTKTSDQLLDTFVAELKANGHVVEVATITHGGRETISAD